MAERLLASPISFHAMPQRAGQAVHYLARGGRWRVEAVPGEFRILPRGASPVRFSFAGAGVKVGPQGERPLPGRVNYIQGSRPEGWVTGLTSYQSVRYPKVLPGVDMVLYGSDREVEYDFVVQPGIDPAEIRLQVDHPWSIQPGGDVAVETAIGSLPILKPKAYQEIEGERVAVEAGFRRLSGDALGFELGDYDPDRPLVIDPILQLSSFLGGTSADSVAEVRVDGEDNLIVVGTTESLDFSIRMGGFRDMPPGAVDIFVMKLDPDGNTLFSTFVGGSGDDNPSTFTVDGDGDIYLTGNTSSMDFPLRNAVQNGLVGGLDAFVLALNAAGTELIYSTYLGGRRQEAGNGIQLDAEGAALVAGFTNSTDFPTTDGALQETYRGGVSDAFAARLSPDGTTLMYSTFLGGNRQDAGRGLGLDPDGNAVVIGATDSTNFPTVNALQGQTNGGIDVFVSKLNGTGSALTYSTYLGGRFSDVVFGALVDSGGDVYFAGETSSFDYPVADPLQGAPSGGVDAFITRLRADGSGLVFSTYLGGFSTDSARAVSFDPQGNLWIAGATASSNFPTRGTLISDPPGTDAFLAAVSPSGSSLLLSTYLGGESTEIPVGLAVDGSGNAYLAGSIDRPGLPLLDPLQDSFGGLGVFGTRNGATGWNGSGDGLDDPNIQALAIDPGNANTVYAGSSSGAYKSTDGGSTWSASGLDNEQVLALAVDDRNDLIYAGTGTGLFQSEDGGESWTRQTQFVPFVPFPVLELDPSQPNTVYAGSNFRGVFKTTDSGETWRAINNGLRGSAQQISALAVDPSNSRTVYAATPRAIYVSRNAGATWEETEANLEDFPVLATLRIDPGNPRTLFSSGTSDTSAIPPEFCDFEPPCNNFVLRSTDGGVNYDVFPVGGLVTELLFDPVSSTTMYAATAASGVFKSTDSGETWEAASTGLDNLRINALAIAASNRNRLLAGTTSGSDGFLMKVAPAQVFYLAQIGEGRQGTIRFQSTVILLNTGADTTARVEFFTSAGAPLALTLGTLGTSSSFDIPLGRGESFSAQTPGEGSIQVGYARITTSAAVGGTAVFTRSDVPTGVILYEVGVPASPAVSGEMSLFVDSLGDRDTGLALLSANPEELGAADTAVDLDLFDRDGNQIAAAEWTLNQGEHRARFVPEIFPEIAEQAGEMQGTLMITPDRPVVALTLRRSEDPNRQFPMTVPTLTSLPVVTSNQLATLLYLPQIADGQVVIPPGVTAEDSFRTGFLFVNSGLFPAFVTLELFDLTGEPLELTVGELGTNSVFQLQVPRGFVFAETPGESSLQIGYARITSSSASLGAAAIFAQTRLASDTVLYEAGVPAARPLREFSLFVDTLGVRNTGLAVVNTSADTAADITFRLYDKAFNLIGMRDVTLQPSRHMARFLTDLLPSLRPQIFEFEGVLTVESSQPLAAVTLRQNDDPNQDFPAEVPTLASFPVVPGRAR